MDSKNISEGVGLVWSAVRRFIEWICEERVDWMSDREDYYAGKR